MAPSKICCLWKTPSNGSLIWERHSNWAKLDHRYTTLEVFAPKAIPLVESFQQQESMTSLPLSSNSAMGTKFESYHLRPRPKWNCPFLSVWGAAWLPQQSRHNSTSAPPGGPSQIAIIIKSIGCNSPQVGSLPPPFLTHFRRRAQTSVRESMIMSCFMQSCSQSVYFIEIQNYIQCMWYMAEVLCWYQILFLLGIHLTHSAT